MGTHAVALLAEKGERGQRTAALKSPVGARRVKGRLAAVAPQLGGLAASLALSTFLIARKRGGSGGGGKGGDGGGGGGDPSGGGGASQVRQLQG